MGKAVMDFLLGFQDTAKVLFGFFSAWLLFIVQQRELERRHIRKEVNAFRMEIVRNELSCKIMLDDKSRTVPFEMEAWNKIKTGNYIRLGEVLALYGYRMTHANNVIQNFLMALHSYDPLEVKTPTASMLSGVLLGAKKDSLKIALNELPKLIECAKEEVQERMKKRDYIYR